MDGTLYLEIFNCDTDSKIELSLESVIIYFVYKQLKSSNLKIKLVLREKRDDEASFIILIDTAYDVVPIKDLPSIGTYCILPIVIFNETTVVSGLSSVARHLIQSTEVDDVARKLLGFRDSCLMACNESSVWTKFCEIDMISSVKDIILNTTKYFNDNKLLIPENFTRFEYHLSQPVRIHNVYKVAKDQGTLKDKKLFSKKIPKNKLELNHEFGEGPFMTLADVILYPLVEVFGKIVGVNIIEKYLPLIYRWFTKMTTEIVEIDVEVSPFYDCTDDIEEVSELETLVQSLYISDPNRYQPKSRIFTKQVAINSALNIIKTLNLPIHLIDKPYGFDVNFNWCEIPIAATPIGGDLPDSRLKRKCEQLENLAKAVIKIAQPNQVIVDFCSGSGHLGILLAVKLPTCKIILIENKEKSMDRARKRIETLQLTNVILLQCNLDYFIGCFDIGVALHACGVATDLVIRHCLQRNAAFVSCPCCYGNIHVCHHISYPRSKIFQNSNLSLQDYLVLGHSADQTHDSQIFKTKQGIKCMNIIDMDRKLQAEELGYKVFLAKMIPESCSPKNNLIVGLPETLFNQI